MADQSAFTTEVESRSSAKPAGSRISDKRRALLEAQLGFDLPPYRLPYEEMKTDYRIGIESLRMALAAELSSQMSEAVNPADVPEDYTTVTEPA